MPPYTKAIGKTIKPMDMEELYMLMVTFTKECGKMIKLMVKANT